ncbi:MAG: hypothetical protein ACT4P3_13190 [Betaproteobacteria bacterium]
MIAAFGCSHSPALNSPLEDMAGHARRDAQYLHHLDREGKHVSFGELAAKNDFSAEVTPEIMQLRIAACAAAIERLGRSIHEKDLDALIVVGDDQKKQYLRPLLLPGNLGCFFRHLEHVQPRAELLELDEYAPARPVAATAAGEEVGAVALDRREARAALGVGGGLGGDVAELAQRGEGGRAGAAAGVADDQLAQGVAGLACGVHGRHVDPGWAALA